MRISLVSLVISLLLFFIINVQCIPTINVDVPITFSSSSPSLISGEDQQQLEQQQFSSSFNNQIHLVKRGFFDSIGNFFKKAASAVGNGLKTAVHAIGNAAKTAVKTVGESVKLAGVAVGTGFDHDAMKKQADKVADTAVKNGKHLAEVAEKDGVKTGEKFKEMGQAFVMVGKEFIKGIVYIGKKIGKWVVDHLAEIAGIAAGILVSVVVGALLSLTTMNPILAGAVAGAAGAFVGNEVKQIVRAAQQGKLRAPTSFGDFMQMTGEHLKDDAIPVITGGLGGAAGAAVGQAVGQAASQSIGKSMNIGADKAMAKGLTDVVSSSGKEFTAKGGTWLAQKGADGATNALVNKGTQLGIQGVESTI